VEIDMSDSPETFQEVQHLLQDDDGKKIYGAGSCDACHSDGYDGRTGLFEVLTMNSELRKLIAENTPTADLHRAAIDSGMIEMRKSALLKMAQGETSMEAVLRQVSAEDLGLSG
jgi:type II secretory ATPase GspE/PulE/Tfp pilus assembly ATPase PilB-like protein